MAPLVFQYHFNALGPLQRVALVRGNRHGEAVERIGERVGAIGRGHARIAHGLVVAGLEVSLILLRSIAVGIELLAFGRLGGGHALDIAFVGDQRHLLHDYNIALGAVGQGRWGSLRRVVRAACMACTAPAQGRNGSQQWQ